MARTRTPADSRGAPSPPSAGDLGPEERVASILGGGALAIAAFARRGAAGLILGAMGAYGVYRGATGRCPATSALAAPRALRALREPTRARATITIGRSPAELYAYWRHLENLPRFLHHIATVETRGEAMRWVLAGPEKNGRDPLFVWYVEIVEEVEGRLLAWRTVPSSRVQHHGLVRFVPAPGERGTEVHVELEYSVSAGRIPGSLASLLGASPDEQLASDLRRLEQLIETGEVATTSGQPSGARGGPIARIVAMRERAHPPKAATPKPAAPKPPNGHGAGTYGWGSGTRGQS